MPYLIRQTFVLLGFQSHLNVGVERKVSKNNGNKNTKIKYY